MRKRYTAALLAAVLGLAACQSPEKEPVKQEEPAWVSEYREELFSRETEAEPDLSVSSEKETLSLSEEETTTDPLAFEWTQPIPEGYLEPAEGGGTVERVDYVSRNYAEDQAETEKHCFVYLPAGYDAERETPYDIAYIMHGFYGSAEELFTFYDGQAKYLFDHMIASGELRPMLIVAPCFDISGVATDWVFSKKELKVFSEELKNDLLPAVEEKYHTFAGAASYENLCASRDHRAFGGFSMGSVCTWYQFVQSCDVIRYFLPMSGACWKYGDKDHFKTEKTVSYLADAARSNKENGLDWMICATVGTNDYMEETVDAQISGMRTEEELFAGSDLKYFKKENGEHFFTAYIEYLYNILPLFFPGE